VGWTLRGWRSQRVLRRDIQRRQRVWSDHARQLSSRRPGAPTRVARTALYVAACVIVPDHAPSHDTVACVADLRAASTGRNAFAAGPASFSFLSALVRTLARRGLSPTARNVVRRAAAGLQDTARIPADSVPGAGPADWLHCYSRPRPVRSHLLLPVRPPV